MRLLLSMDVVADTVPKNVVLPLPLAKSVK
jgi:hypothetical protein